MHSGFISGFLAITHNALHQTIKRLHYRVNGWQHMQVITLSTDLVSPGALIPWLLLCDHDRAAWHNWSLNYTSKVSGRGRLIHHGGEARPSELAAVTSGVPRTLEPRWNNTEESALLPSFQWHPGPLGAFMRRSLLFCWWLGLLDDSKLIMQRCSTTYVKEEEFKAENLAGWTR